MSKGLRAFLIAIYLLALSVFPVYASKGAPNYVLEQTRQMTILGFGALIIIATLIVYYFGGARQGEETGLWVTALTFASLSIIGIIVIWVMVSKSSPDENKPGHYRVLSGQSDVKAVMDEQIEAAKQGNTEKPIFIPTGVFIQSMEFNGANDVTVTGYVWQKYSDDIPANVSRGFVMPEGDVIEGTEAYRIHQGNEEVIGWYIQTNLRQTFDYAHYPLDRQDIWLRMWHKDFARNVLLVPDYASYKVTEWNQFNLLGLEKDFVLERLALERTYYNYHYNSYNTDFGIDNYVGQNSFPELYFNVGVKREVLDAFVAYLIPMFILVLMAFGVQFIVTQIAEKMSMHGISTTGLIGYYASLFFIGILAQLDIRRTLNAPGVVYIEYFYFILYVILLLQTVNSVIFAATDSVGFLEYKDNLYPKVIFFPVIVGLMFIVTAILFF